MKDWFSTIAGKIVLSAAALAGAGAIIALIISAGKVWESPERIDGLEAMVPVAQQNVKRQFTDIQETLTLMHEAISELQFDSKLNQCVLLRGKELSECYTEMPSLTEKQFLGGEQ